MKKNIYFVYRQLYHNDGVIDCKIDLSENVNEIIKINEINHETNGDLLRYYPNDYYAYQSVVGIFVCDHCLNYYKKQYKNSKHATVYDYFKVKYFDNDYIKISSLDIVK